ncbi:monocarboxylate transporter 2-like [Hippocampus zosterae]|uniref:monocarboxylate transporter 2-like n=1 Tax=Hippocampus zosterae TaxID=109293 RepID=UPI00223E2048|nr:monocarboxylate transporter 2-like [Hippocampus zosterae]XP_051932425.1 monocarboxylate transporter 2-like [Hippocampus zosterae]
MSPAPATREQDLKPPDGGWGWMVVMGAHISIGFSYATPKALSIFFKDIQLDLQAGYSEIAWISSIMLAAMYAGGPVSSALVDRYGSRPIVILGGLMCGGSMVVASFGNSIVYLYLCIGVTAGCGLALNLNASLTIISKYFLARRPLANGLAMAGSPVFLCFLAPFNQYLLDKFGWRGSFLILGAVMLHCCVAGALMRPVGSRNSPPTKAEERPDRGGGGCVGRAKKIVDWSFFKDRAFVIYLVGNILFIFGAYAPIVFLSAYAVSRGVDQYSAAYLLSIMGFVDMFVRPGTGLIANSKWVRPRVQYLFSLAVVFNGACHLLCPLIETYAFLVVYAVFFGVAFGMVFALIFECLMDLMGPRRFPRAVGLVTIIECVPMLLGPPTAGLLVDLFDDYQYLFLLCGAVIASGGIFLFVMNLYNYRRPQNERAGQPQPNDPARIQNALHLDFCAKESAVPESADGAEPAAGGKMPSMSNLHLPVAAEENGGRSPPPNRFAL